MTASPKHLVNENILYAMTPLIWAMRQHPEQAARLFELSEEEIYTWQGIYDLCQPLAEYVENKSEEVCAEISDELARFKKDPASFYNDELNDLLSELGLDAYLNEALEYWLVSDWLYQQLAKQGECVFTFQNLPIWGRATSGQLIELDYVIQFIARLSNEA